MTRSTPAHIHRVTLVIAACLVATPLLGAELFVKRHGSGTTCAQSAPCSLATALATAAAGDRVLVAAGTYKGTGPEVVLIGRSIELLGGWDGSPSGAVTRDPIANPTILDGENARRVVTIASAEPTVDGFTITHGNATGLTTSLCGHLGAPDGCGGGIYANTARAVISGNTVVGNVAATASHDDDHVGYGGGIAAYNSAGIEIRGNTIRGNTASAAGHGFGGGLSLVYCGGAIVEGNRIVGNAATLAEAAPGEGGGVAMHFIDPEAAVRGNVLRDNTAAPTDDWGRGNAIFTWTVAAAFSRNHIDSDAVGDTVYLGQLIGGFTANRVHARGDALVLRVRNGSGSDVVVANNFLIGERAERVVYAEGAVERPLSLAFTHNTVVGGGGQSTGVLARWGASVSVTNTIVTDHQTGLAADSGGTLTADHTLFWSNADDGIRGTDPVDGDPLFLNRAFGNMHIDELSPARGSGADVGVATDIDGDPRPGPGGVDIGADEAERYWGFDFGTPTSPLGQGGYIPVSELTAYAPAQGFGWLSGTIVCRDRGGVSDLTRDFCFAPLATFAVDVPNGRYRVKATLGDRTNGHDQMGVYLEGQIVATVNAQADNYPVVTADTSVTDGQLTVLLDDRGGADPNVVINALVIEPALPVMLDLGTAGSPVAAGYTRVTPETRYSAAAGLGWLGGVVQARDRGIANPLLRDFHFSPLAAFGLFLANGVYDLTVTLGDSAAAHEQMGVSAQGAPFDALTAARNQFLTRTYRTCVADNQLRLLLGDLGGTDWNVVVNAIAVAPPPLPYFDFGTASSPVGSRWLQVTPATAYAPWRGFGWTSGSVSSRDRGTGGDLLGDFAVTKDAEFAVDVLNGSYDVQIYMGDTAAAHDAMAVSLEGVTVDTVSTLPGQFFTHVYRVVVTDGQLNVGLSDHGGTDPNVVINTLKLR
jgi:fibronectin type 3 domain-containing protein